MQFLHQEGDNLIFQNLFNAEHAGQIITSLSASFTTITFRNVGVKIMKLILNYFEEAKINRVNIEYNWNSIMTNPKLICYDKGQWKTLQQLNNWNRQWSELLASCYYLTTVTLNIQCSWMDHQFAQQFLESLAKAPNIQSVGVIFASKNKGVQEILSAIQKAKIFKEYQYQFKQLQ